MLLVGAAIERATRKKKQKGLGSTQNVDTEIIDIEALGLPYISYQDEKKLGETEIAGLGKAVTTDDIYQMITDKMLAMIKEASGKGYKKKWKGDIYGTGYLIPFNFDSKKRYRGVNYFLLTGFEPLENPYFLTFKQVEKLGGTVKKGSFGNKVIYFTKLYKVEDKAKNVDFGSYDLKKVKSVATKSSIPHEKITYIPILKYYNVFNGKDIDGIDFDLHNFKIGFINKPLPPTNKMEIPEAILKHYPKPQPILRFGGDKAYHQGGGVGKIQMPYMADFETAQDYYRTLFHEYAHSTGSPERLNRKIGTGFGTKDYAFEELVAEWGATFLSAESGIIFHTNNNHAEYIKNWNNALTHIKDDTRFIMRACSKAQELTDFILDRDKNGEPKYLKDFKPKKEVVNFTFTVLKSITPSQKITKFKKYLKDNADGYAQVAKDEVKYREKLVDEQTILHDLISNNNKKDKIVKTQLSKVKNLEIKHKSVLSELKSITTDFQKKLNFSYDRVFNILETRVIDGRKEFNNIIDSFEFVESKSNSRTEHINLIKKLCTTDLKEFDFEPTKHKFKAGDKYRSDFDYKGMLTAGTKITAKTTIANIEKLYNSFVDVNYHEIGSHFWNLLELMKSEKPTKKQSEQLALFGAKKPKRKYTKKR